MTTYQILSLAGVQALVTAVIGGIVAAVFARINKKLAKAAEKKNEDKEKIELLALGIQALLRNELYKLYDKAIMDGYVTTTDQKNFINLWEKYHSLGANGVMDQIKNDYLEFKVVRK